jgi:all-trans-retinol dehydrogenase (NAD+)
VCSSDLQALLPGMLERDRGHVVTTASASSFYGVAKLSDYAASKWAAYGFNESLRMELRRQKSSVKTTVVCPYYVNTGLFAGARSRFPRLMPILDEADVAARAVRAVEQNKARLYMPPTIGIGHVLRFLPVSWFDRFNDFLGSNRSMDDFTGRPTAN